MPFAKTCCQDQDGFYSHFLRLKNITMPMPIDAMTPRQSK